MYRIIAIFLAFALATTASAQEQLPPAPIPARAAAAHMTVPDGFRVTLFAGEPDVVQPIAFTFDDRGRLWVIENFSYPKWNKESAVEKSADGRYLDRRSGKDRIVIFEDTDGDGRFDKRTVFADNLTNLSGIQYGYGGVWLCSIPNLLYIPFKKGDRTFLDEPAGPPEIKLDGWSMQSSHNAFNSPKWGPDGWLYGCNGILANSMVGTPGTPEKDRTPMNCGVWRYHPTKKKFEVVAHGTTNPWGLDWDEYGEMFITNCVIDHVWHVVPGGHYERMYGNDYNPNLYKLMPSIADHKHWAGGNWTESRGGKGAHSDAGGGHAHVGCMVYLGDNWPKQYRGGMFTLNLHGNRVNHDILERKGSSYVAHHGKDFLFANDPWFRGIALDYGPDGGVYVSDWTDTGECHNYQVADQTNGRIYKVTYGKAKEWKGDLAKLSDKELVALQGHENEWFVRHARRLLAERHAAGKLDAAALDALTPVLSKDASAVHVLRSMWTRHVTGTLDTYTRYRLIDGSPHETVRATAVTLALDDSRAGAVSGPNDTRPPLEELIVRVAQEDKSPLVRLHIASAAQRFPKGHHGLVIGWHLSQHVEDQRDPYLPLMTWYAVEKGPMDQMISLITDVHIPLVREYLARRIAAADPSGNSKIGIAGLVAQLKYADSAGQRDVLRGIYDSLKGRRTLPVPTGWETAYADLKKTSSNDVRDLTMSLAVMFGDEKALIELRHLVQDATVPADRRRAAMHSLLQKQSPAELPMLYALLDDPALREASIQALAAYADPKTPSLILDRYPKFSTGEKSDAVHTLASRPAYALALLDAVADKKVARTDLNAFTVRQLLALNDKNVTKRVNEVWGTLRPASQEKAALMTKYKKLLTAATLKQANLQSGRLVFTKQCATCHKFFGEGSAIGPELTGSQRTNLDYVLENMLDPSAVVPREYQVSIIATANGRTLTGIVKEETERALTVQTQNEIVIVPKDEIELRKQSNLSMMPEGILDRMTIEEIRDLVAYLASPTPPAISKQGR